MTMRLSVAGTFRLGLLSAIICSSQSEYVGVTIETCKLQVEYVHSSFIALARINRTVNERPQSLRGDQISCATLQAQKQYVVLDLILNGDPPIEIHLQMTEKFALELNSSVILCSYSEIGKLCRVDDIKPANTTQSSKYGIYVCTTTSLQVVFTGIPAGLVGSHKRRRRSLRSDTVKCYNNSYHSNVFFEKLGDACHIENVTGQRYMFTESGMPDCVTCCPNHYFDEFSMGCEKCPHGTIQPEMNVWTNCEVKPSSETGTPSTEIKTTTPAVTAITASSPTRKSKQTKHHKRYPPREAPTGLIVTNLGQHHAVIEWEAVPTRRNIQIEYYNITKLDFPSNASTEFCVAEGKTWKNLTGLDPESCYEITVQAGNSFGLGPSSDILVVHTLRNLPKLENLHRVGGGGIIKFRWNAKTENSDLAVKVELWKQGATPGTGYAFTKYFCKGEISFHPPFPGKFSVQLFYATEGQIGPKSEIMQVEYQHETNENPAAEGQRNRCIEWIIFCIFLLLIIIVALLVLAYRKYCQKPYIRGHVLTSSEH